MCRLLFNPLTFSIYIFKFIFIGPDKFENTYTFFLPYKRITISTTIMDFSMFPLDVFAEKICIHLSNKELVSLKMVGKDMLELMNEETIWKQIYKQILSTNFYHTLYKRLKNSKSPRSKINYAEHDRINPYPLVIENDTKSLDFDIVCVGGFENDNLRGYALRGYAHLGTETKRPYLFKKQATIKPGQKWLHRGVYHGDMFVCIPTSECLQTTPCSNVGFSFRAYEERMEDYKFWYKDNWVVKMDKNDIDFSKGNHFGKKYSTVNKRAHVKRINEPKVYNPIKGIDNVYSNYQYMCHMMMKGLYLVRSTYPLSWVKDDSNINRYPYKGLIDKCEDYKAKINTYERKIKQFSVPNSEKFDPNQQRDEFEEEFNLWAYGEIRKYQKKSDAIQRFIDM